MGHHRKQAHYGRAKVLEIVFLGRLLDLLSFVHRLEDSKLGK